MRTFARKPKASQPTKSARSVKADQAHSGRSRDVHPILHLQRTIGNQAVQRLPHANVEGFKVGSRSASSPRFAHDFGRNPVHASGRSSIQPTLKVNAPGNIYEQEADRVADQVMRMPEPQLQRACACGGGCPKCQAEQRSQEHKRLQTKRVQASDTGKIAAPPIVHEVLRSSGQPLDTRTRAFMEPRVGYDFSRVRVHTDVQSADSAQALHARAFTLGSDIMFGTGQYEPETRQGRRLIAHELAHVVQQSNAFLTSDGTANGRLSPSPIRVARQPDDADPPTFGNLPGELPDPRAQRVQLIQKGGKWYELRPNGQRWRAKGSYDFVVQKRKIWAVKGSNIMGGLNPGHTEAAAGGRVEYAGTIRFGSGKNTRGTLVEWSNASGHYLPAKTFAKNAGLPLDNKFKAYKGPRPAGPKLQLPVFQPGSKSPAAGGAAKPLGGRGASKGSKASKLGKASAAILADAIVTLADAAKELGLAYLEQRLIDRDIQRNVIPRIEPALRELTPKLETLRKDTSQLPVFLINVKFKMHYKRYTETTWTGGFDRSPSPSVSFRTVFDHLEFDSADVSRQNVKHTKELSDLIYLVTFSVPIEIELTAEEEERLRRHKAEEEKRERQQLESNLRRKFDECMEENVPVSAGAEAATEEYYKAQERCYARTGYMFWTEKSDQ